MKIDEFIKKVNRVAYAEATGDDICIYASEKKGKAHPYDYFLQLFPDEQGLDPRESWSDIEENGDHMDEVDLFYILGLVQELRKTPAKERFPEKKYRLRWIDDGDGIRNYIEMHDATFYWNYGPGERTFTEAEIDQLKRDNPRFAPAIDCMKEEVKDDE